MILNVLKLQFSNTHSLYFRMKKLILDVIKQRCLPNACPWLFLSRLSLYFHICSYYAYRATFLFLNGSIIQT
jgi:hypothetical protein